MITLDLPPQIQHSIQAYANEQGVSVHDYIVQAIQNRLASEPTMLFDIDVMKERLKGLENKEEALKNSVSVPTWALADFDSFEKWLAERDALRTSV
ncbi:Uncharacterised protein [Moraxella caprae]|uniref:Uncharacterized protein n=4 Tax=Moraxella TaxID=475 RepID=A0A378R116_9GAMM|nr:hypothetical protein [Moraxella caprae]STZ08489.1 Uncharacterised protein [Moraxella caprae]